MCFFFSIKGGCTRNGSLIFTFTDNCNENDIKADNYRKAIDYFCNIPSESDKDKGFSILIDRRTDKWSSVKNVLILIQEYFPAKLNSIYILRPQSYFQRVFSTIFFQEDSYSNNNNNNNPINSNQNNNTSATEAKSSLTSLSHSNNSSTISKRSSINYSKSSRQQNLNVIIQFYISLVLCLKICCFYALLNLKSLYLNLRRFTKIILSFSAHIKLDNNKRTHKI